MSRMQKGCSALAMPMNFREASQKKRSRINMVSPGRIGMLFATAKLPVLHGLGRDTHFALQAVKIGRRIRAGWHDGDGRSIRRESALSARLGR